MLNKKFVHYVGGQMVILTNSSYFVPLFLRRPQSPGPPCAALICFTGAFVAPIPHTSLRAMIPLSVLDLSVVTTGTKPAAALRNSIDLARHVDGLGYIRYWLAEHHNLASVASP